MSGKTPNRRPARRSATASRKTSRKRKKPFLGKCASLLRSWSFWIGVCLAIAAYYLVYQFVVAPFTLRWKALYGEVDYPEGYSIRGIDISHHQGTIDWEQLSRAKVGDEPVCFVFIKATEGKTHLDENFNDNFYQAGEYGFVRGVYHYFHPSVPAAEQAAYFLKQVHLEDGDLPPVLDFETVGNLSKTEVRKAALTWLKTVEKHYGVKPIIYTYYKFKETYLNTPEFKDYPYWIAHYYVKELRYKGPWKFWQYTDCGRLPGIKGHVDLNIYNGSMYDLRKLTIDRGERP